MTPRKKKSVAVRLPERDDEVFAGAVAYQIVKPFAIGALGAELTEAVDGEGRVELVAEGDVLWVDDDRVDETVLARVLADHGTTKEP
jgi:hypothetical protein